MTKKKSSDIFLQMFLHLGNAQTQIQIQGQEDLSSRTTIVLDQVKFAPSLNQCCCCCCSCSSQGRRKRCGGPRRLYRGPAPTCVKDLNLLTNYKHLQSKIIGGQFYHKKCRAHKNRGPQAATYLAHASRRHWVLLFLLLYRGLF